MARWNPHNSVGLNEQIGRRLFDEPMLRGAMGQPSYGGIQLTHFEEKRGDEVSLDRLGASGIDRQVRRYLIQRAEADGGKFGKPKRFDGWAVVAAKELIHARGDPKLPIYSSPVSEPEPKDNIYHAHVLRPEGWNSYQMALHLRHIFTSHGRVEPNKIVEETWQDIFWAHAITKWILSKLNVIWRFRKIEPGEPKSSNCMSMRNVSFGSKAELQNDPLPAVQPRSAALRGRAP